MGFRARISLSGSDRVRWMNGMVTNNIRDLATGHGVYAFLLNPQGRILGDVLFITRAKLFGRNGSQPMEKIARHLRPLHHHGRREVTNLSEPDRTGPAWDQSRAPSLNAAGIEVPELQPLQIMRHNANAIATVWSARWCAAKMSLQQSYEIWLAPKDVYKTWQARDRSWCNGGGQRSLGNAAHRGWRSALWR